MRKVKLYIAMSLNGKIAKSDGSVGWLGAIPKPVDSDYGYAEFYNSVDTTIQGYNTYKQILSWNIEFPYKGKKNYVFTRNNLEKDTVDASFIIDNHLEFVQKLKKRKGKDIWLIGGGETNASLLDANLIDELYIFAMPIILENGIDLFGLLSKEKSLNLIKSKSYSTGVVEMIYQL